MSAVATPIGQQHRLARLATVSACAPGRVCLAGESLDWMTGGPSVVATVPLHTEVSVVRDGAHGPILLHSPDTEPNTRSVKKGDLGVYAGDGLDYMQATVNVVSRLWSLPLDGATVQAHSTVPVGAGLSSSAALTVASAAALLRLAAGAVPSAVSVAQAAYDAEAVQLSTGAGWMDFLACTYGGVCRIDADIPPRVTRLADLGAPLVLVDTLQRRTTRAVLASKRDRFRAGERAMLTYAQAATAVVTDLTAVLSTPLVDPAGVGDLLNQAHTLLRDLVGCSTDLINECVARCLTAGAYGAKLTGSGHGGCLVALTAVDAIGPVVTALHDLPVRVMVFTTSEPHGVVFPASEL